MEIAQTTTSTVAQTGATETSSDSSALASSDFETFLKLLTAQMENQDPLKPMESTEFVAQLASFSAVEQQILTNTRLEDMASSLTSSQTANAAGWLGKNVLAPTAGEFDGGSMEVHLSPNSKATRATIEVLDNNGVLVAALPVATDERTFLWDGTKADGTQAENGFYSFQVNYYEGQEKLEANQGLVYAKVDEVQINNTSLDLVFGDGSSVDASQITRIGL